MTSSVGAASQEPYPWNVYYHKVLCLPVVATMSLLAYPDDLAMVAVDKIEEGLQRKLEHTMRSGRRTLKKKKKQLELAQEKNRGSNTVWKKESVAN